MAKVKSTQTVDDWLDSVEANASDARDARLSDGSSQQSKK